MINISMKIHSGGFTIIELLVTIVIAGFIIVAISTLLITTDGTQRSTRLLETAMRAGETQIESLRNNTYNTLEPGVDIDFTNELPSTLIEPRSGRVVVTEPVVGVRRVDVTVSYRDGDRQKNVKLSSLIGQLGIGQ
jgi:prepilin-type N-terminal cleavage/methylation domain-containing protein